MKVRISHKSYIFLEIAVGIMLLASALMFLDITFETFSESTRKAGGMALFALAGASACVFLLQSSAEITVSDGTLRIKYTIGCREINIRDIKRVRFTHHKYHHSGGEYSSPYEEYRVKLEIIVFPDSKAGEQKVTLNDKAGKNTPLPDEELPLYQVYKCLLDLTGLEANDDIV